MVGAGMRIEPPISPRPPFATVSFVAALPPSSVGWVSAGSSVSEIEVPATAEPDSVKTKCRTRWPGEAALSVKGIGLVDSLNVSRREIEPAVEGENSEGGGRLAVRPARVNVTDETADAGAYVTLMLNDWMREPAGWSRPSGVPETSRMETGTSTVLPDAVTVPTVITSTAACAAAGERKPARRRRTRRRRFGRMEGSWGQTRMRMAIAPRVAARRTSIQLLRAGTPAGGGIPLIAPGTRRRLPLATLSFVAPLPPSSVSWVSVASSVSRMVVPGVADGASVTVRWPTWLPGAAALSVDGMSCVASGKVSRRDTVPGPEGESSSVGVSGWVMPARVKVIDCTADAGA